MVNSRALMFSGILSRFYISESRRGFLVWDVGEMVKFDMSHRVDTLGSGNATIGSSTCD